MSPARTARRFRVAVIGCGRVYERGHRAALRSSPEFELVALCDASEHTLARAGAASPGVKLCRSFAELPTASLDAVLIATPPASHRELCTGALAAGLAVLVEKPMGSSLEDARAIQSAARAAARLLRVGYVRRVRPSYRALRAHLEVASAGIERVRSRMRFDRARWFGARDARRDREVDGGVLDDVASHQLDLLAWLFSRPVVRVRSEAWVRGHGTETLRYQVELSGGLRAVCEASHASGSEEWVRVETAREVAVARAYTLHRLPRWARIERALPAVDLAHLAAARLSRRPNASALGFIAQLHGFARALAGEHEDLADGEAAVRVHAALDACRRSAERGGAWEGVE